MYYHKLFRLTMYST